MAARFKGFHHLPMYGSRPLLSISRVLAWADAHHPATGRWPTSATPGPIRQSPFGETWCAINALLIRGSRGLPRGLTLARLIHKYRGVKPLLSEGKTRKKSELHRRLLAERLPGRATLTVERIVALAVAHHAATGRWPRLRSGPVRGLPGETWSTIARSLKQGRCGLPRDLTLGRLLAQHLGREALSLPPAFTVEQILGWADVHRAAHGRWPTVKSGRVAAAPSETWLAVNHALKRGLRGLPPGSSLACLLAARRNARNRTSLPQLTPEQVLAWAEAHRAATGKWPTDKSGAVIGAPDEDWNTISEALRLGRRGLPGGSSLPLLLNQHHPERCRNLTVETILAWAEAFHAACGRWPQGKDGAIASAPGERWCVIDQALRKGSRGLPYGLSLARLFKGRPAPARKLNAGRLDQGGTGAVQPD